MKQVIGALLGTVLLSAAFLAVGSQPSYAETGGNGGEVVEHTVLKGDNLMLLAGYYFKDPRQWKRIYRANGDILGNPNLIIPGTVLRIKGSGADRWNIPYEDFFARASN